MSLTSMKNDFYIFCSFDEWYADLSYVFFTSFNQYNADKIIHAHCINFSADKLEEYKKNVSTYFSNVIVEAYDQQLNNKLLTYDDRESTAYAAHTESLEHKIKVWSLSKEKHILYLDIDTLIRKDISPLISDASTNVIGSRMHQEKGYGYNAGVITINQPEHQTMWEQYKKLINDCPNKVGFPEEYLLDNIKDYTRGEFDVHLHCTPASREFNDDTVVVHFFPKHIKLWTLDIDTLAQDIFGTKFSINASNWYALYDKVKLLGILSDRFCNNVDKKRSIINNFLQLKANVDNRRNKLYGSVL